MLKITCQSRLCGEGDTGTGSVIEALMAMLLSDKLGSPVTDQGERSPEIESLRKQIRESMQNTSQSKPATDESRKPAKK